MKYIKKFDTLSAQTEYFNSAEIDTYVGYVVENDTVYYDNAIVINYAKKYLTIEALENGNLTFTNSNNTLYYSLDKTTWNPITSADTVSFHAGDNIMLKGTNMAATSTAGIGTINFSGNHNVFGNILTLISGDEFPQQIIYSTQQFRYLFNGDTKLISAENLKLTSTTNGFCYAQMFKGCTSLTKAPELPATNISPSAYREMFRDCTSLTEAPTLPASNVQTYGYYGMFQGCTSLTQAPVLNAQTVANTSYQSMFNGCTSLSYVKMMTYPIDSAATINWLSGVASSGTLVTYCDTELPSGASGLPNGWTQVKQEYDGSECSSGGDWEE